jgi:hypothetical protein
MFFSRLKSNSTLTKGLFVDAGATNILIFFKFTNFVKSLKLFISIYSCSSFFAGSLKDIFLLFTKVGSSTSFELFIFLFSSAKPTDFAPSIPTS